MFEKAGKKIIGASLVILASANVHSAIKEGIYLGGGIGASIDNFELSGQNLTTGSTLETLTRNEVSYIGNFFTGFGQTFNQNFYLGGEAGTYFSNRSRSITRPGLNLTGIEFTNVLSVQDYLTFDILPGYRWGEDLLIYGRLGLSYANMKLYQYPTLARGELQAESKKLGGRIGAGVGFTLDQHLGIGLDYFYSKYSQMKTSFNGNSSQLTQNITSNYLGISAIYTI